MEIKEFIKDAYKSILGSECDDNGINYYAQLISTNKIKCNDLPNIFYNSDEYKNKKEIFICIGVGDLFFNSCGPIKNKTQKNFVFILSREMVEIYRNSSQKYIDFINTFFKKIGIIYRWVDKGTSILDYGSSNFMIDNGITDKSEIYNIYQDIFNLRLDRSKKLPPKYIVMHTKYRLESKKYELDKITEYFKTFKINLPIIIMGEKKITRTFENDILDVVSLYDILLGLKKENIVIDYTTTNDQVDPNFEAFEKDLYIIRHACYNIVFGQGGNFNICCFISRRFIAYIDNFSHYVTKCCSQGTLCRSIESMLCELDKLKSEN